MVCWGYGMGELVEFTRDKDGCSGACKEEVYDGYDGW